MNLITYSKSLNQTKKLKYLVGGLFNRIAWRNKVFYAEENNRIILQFNNSFIDFLKIDIEGGEFDVLNPSNNLSWLNKVKVLALEIHDEYGNRNIIDSILTDHGFFIYRSGELAVAVNLNKLLLNEK